jgi:hypothetical protein
MRGVYSALLLHMDDSNESIRNAALGTIGDNTGLKVLSIHTHESYTS